MLSFFCHTNLPAEAFMDSEQLKELNQLFWGCKLHIVELFALFLTGHVAAFYIGALSRVHFLTDVVLVSNKQMKWTMRRLSMYLAIDGIVHVSDQEYRQPHSCRSRYNQPAQPVFIIVHLKTQFVIEGSSVYGGVGELAILLFYLIVIILRRAVLWSNGTVHTSMRYLLVCKAPLPYCRPLVPSMYPLKGRRWFRRH